MAEEIGWAGLGIAPTFQGFDSQLARGVDPALNKVGQTSGKRFGGIMGKAAAVAVGGALAAGYGAFRLGKEAVSLAGEFEQSVGAVDAIFKDNAKTIHRWAEGAAMDVGLSANEFNELGTLIGAQLKNGGTAMDELAPKTNELITLGADVASMFGGTTREAVEALSSALKGERDPIERYGVSLKQATIDAEAAELGFKKVDGALSSEAQQAATLSLIMEQTADSHGNFARESDTLAGKQQRLHARLEDVKTELGTALLPVVTDVTEYLLDKGVPAFEKFSDWFAEKGMPALGDFAEDVKPLANELLPAIGDAMGVAKDALDVAVPLVKDMVGAFNDMPDEAKTFLLLMAGGAVVGKKAGLFGLLGKGGKGGAGASIAGVPMGVTPVWVVNGGAAGTPGGGAGGKGGKTPVGAVARGVLGRALGLGSLNFLLTGDQGPQAERSNTSKAYIKLTELVGAETHAGYLDALNSASAEQLREWRKVLNKEFGVGFSQLSRFQLDNNGGPAVPEGLTARAQTRRDQHMRDFFAEGTELEGLLKKIPDRVETKFFTPGLADTREEVDALIKRYDLKLDRRDVRTLYELLGVDKAISDYDRIISKQRELARVMGHQISLDIPGPGRSTQGGAMQGTGLNINYNGPVTYTDDREGRRRAQQRHRRSQVDNIPRGAVQ